MADVRIYIRYQQSTLTSSSIRKVDRRRMYVFVINKVLKQDEIWHYYTIFE